VNCALTDRDWADQLSSENPAFEALSVAELEPPPPGSLRGPVVDPDPWGEDFPFRPETSGHMPPTTESPSFFYRVSPWISSSRYCALCQAHQIFDLGPTNVNALSSYRCLSAARHAHAARRASLEPSYRARVLRVSAERRTYDREVTCFRDYMPLRPYEGLGRSTSLGNQFLDPVLRRHQAARTDLEPWIHFFDLRLRKKTGGMLVWGAAFDLVWARRLRSVIQLLLLRRQAARPRIPPAPGPRAYNPYGPPEGPSGKGESVAPYPSRMVPPLQELFTTEDIV
jgi:hypothetical protein